MKGLWGWCWLSNSSCSYPYFFAAGRLTWHCGVCYLITKVRLDHCLCYSFMSVAWRGLLPLAHTYMRLSVCHQWFALVCLFQGVAADGHGDRCVSAYLWLVVTHLLIGKQARITSLVLTFCFADNFWMLNTKGYFLIFRKSSAALEYSGERTWGDRVLFIESKHEIEGDDPLFPVSCFWSII